MLIRLSFGLFHHQKGLHRTTIAIVVTAIAITNITSIASLRAIGIVVVIIIASILLGTGNQEIHNLGSFQVGRMNQTANRIFDMLLDSLVLGHSIVEAFG